MSKQQPWLLMCPPDFYGIEYEINPWMSRSKGADTGRAARQWRGLYDTLLKLGAKISLLEPLPGLPDMVFTANAGMMYRNLFISSQFRHAVRAGESPHYEKWFEASGFPVHRLKTGMTFEGAGDALFCGPTLFGGYRIRSDVRSHHQVARIIGHQTLPLELVDPRFYHLDTCFCPIAPGSAIWLPAAFDPYGQRVIRQNIADLIEATPEEAMKFGCNAVIVGHSAIVPVDCAALCRELESHQFDVHELELDEFLKAGGSAKCLTLRIDGEEASVWGQSKDEVA